MPPPHVSAERWHYLDGHDWCGRSPEHKVCCRGDAKEQIRRDRHRALIAQGGSQLEKVIASFVTLVDATQTDTKLFLTMEVVPGTESFDIALSGPLSERDARTYMSQIVSAIAYLHSNGVLLA